MYQAPRGKRIMALARLNRKLGKDQLKSDIARACAEFEARRRRVRYARNAVT